MASSGKMWNQQNVTCFGRRDSNLNWQRTKASSDPEERVSFCPVGGEREREGKTHLDTKEKSSTSIGRLK